MNCHNCNAPLSPESNVCPNCGALNGVNPSDASMSTMIDLDDDEETTPQISENMAPPSLDVKEENLTSGVKDIGAGNNISTYGEMPVEEQTEENHQANDATDVDIEIPKVQTPVENIEMPSDGSAPSIDGGIPTVGEIESPDTSTVKFGNKTFKIKMGKSKKVPKVILIGGIIVFFIMGVLVGSTVFKQNVCVSSTSTKMKTTTKVTYVSNGKNNETKAGNYTYKIPQNYTYDKKNSGVIIYSDTGDWRIFIKAEAGLYDDLATARVSVEETLKENSVTVNNLKETKISDNNYIIIEGTTRLQNRLIAFTDAKNDHVFYIEIVTTDNSYNYELLSLANDIALSATYNDTVSDIEHIDVYDAATMLITASEADKSQNNGS
ncbi:MAG: zinc ribbon domain-containing protein [Bacilli bacterium]|nr:zinc ribbon domain-containing protein [Bacilli bacterium]